jgi:hypothetical protein
MRLFFLIHFFVANIGRLARHRCVTPLYSKFILSHLMQDRFYYSIICPNVIQCILMSFNVPFLSFGCKITSSRAFTNYYGKVRNKAKFAAPGIF